VSGTGILVAGAGNVFRGDQGFGVEVVARLSRQPLPDGVTVRDYGIRGLHLSYALLAPPALLIVVDAVGRGELPGTLFVIEPTVTDDDLTLAAGPHGMSLPAVFATVQAMGGTLPRVLIVGCEPASLDETRGLSPAVERAVAPALELVRTLLERELEAGVAAKPGDIP
jgi:hydrogenase maturation protease